MQDIGRYREAEAIAQRIAEKDLPFDYRNLVELYAASGQIETMEYQLRKFDLTRAERSLLLDWKSALIDGRELIAET
ncbi:MAG: hypothetical protein AAF226_15930, partial [Verrucomicrobiota bacterium]